MRIIKAGAAVAQGHREKMILTLPPDPALAGLAHLATLHFFRQNGAGPLEARRCARTVQARARVLLRGAARRGRAALALVLTSGASSLEAALRGGPSGAVRPVASLRHRDPA